MTILEPLYRKLTVAAKQDLKGAAVAAALGDVIEAGQSYLKHNCEQKELKSKVPDKAYFMFRLTDANKTSRPVNSALFDATIEFDVIKRVLRGDVSELSTEVVEKVLYTSAMTYCCTTDVTKSNDKKSPGTFFEVLIGHLVSQAFDVNPKTYTEIPSLDIENRLPTDYVFDLGPGKNRIHLPVKTSTRERVVQVWAHQRVLDGLHGTNRFKGLLVSLTETNKQKDKSVVEVCLPGQWVVYQMYIAQMHRIYYLDVPRKYEPLNDVYPFIHVASFATFFDEVEKIAKAAPLA